MVERKCSGESSIQLMRGPRLEADSWAWDWPIVMGEPKYEDEIRWKTMKKRKDLKCEEEKRMGCAYHNSKEQDPQRQHVRSHPLPLQVRWCSRLGLDRFRGHESREGCSMT